MRNNEQGIPSLLCFKLNALLMRNIEYGIMNDDRVKVNNE